MCSTTILAVGLDSPKSNADRRKWQSEGYFVTWTHSIREAIEWFRVGDFDLVLLGGSIPAETRERLTFLIRASGSSAPVISVKSSSISCDSFAGTAIDDGAGIVFRRIGEILPSNMQLAVVKTGGRGLANLLPRGKGDFGRKNAPEG